MLVLGSSTQEADCKNCAAGTYSTVEAAVAISVCNNCPSGKYTVNAAQDELADCISCGQGKYSTATPSGTADNCVSCNTGTWSAALGANTVNTCTQCLAGTFNTNRGSISQVACTACLAGSYCTAGVASPIACTRHTTSGPGSTTASACICLQGYTGNNSSLCTACVAEHTKWQQDPLRVIYVARTHFQKLPISPPKQHAKRVRLVPTHSVSQDATQ